MTIVMVTWLTGLVIMRHVRLSVCYLLVVYTGVYVVCVCLQYFCVMVCGMSV